MRSNEMLRPFAATAGLSGAGRAMFFLYGPHEHPERLVSSVILALLRGEPAKSSHGRQIRDYMHVQDVADGLVGDAATAKPRARSTSPRAGHDDPGNRAHGSGRWSGGRSCSSSARFRRAQRRCRWWSATTRRTWREIGLAAAVRSRGGPGHDHRLVEAASVREATEQHERADLRSGSGMAGFGAAHRLHESGDQPVIFESAAYYGGHTASYRYEGG